MSSNICVEPQVTVEITACPSYGAPGPSREPEMLHPVETFLQSVGLIITRSVNTGQLYTFLPVIYRGNGNQITTGPANSTVT